MTAIYRELLEREPEAHGSRRTLEGAASAGAAVQATGGAARRSSASDRLN